MLCETSIIDQINDLRLRSPKQKNGPHETDAEIVDVIDVNNQLLAITSDSLVEEIQRGLVVDPYCIGWTAALMSLSDLSAVGAMPIGIMLGLSIPRNMSSQKLKSIYQGVEDCCRAHNTFVLGGDTNHCNTLSINTTAIGTVGSRGHVSRTPIAVDSALYVSGNVGSGNLAALLNLNSRSVDRILLPKQAALKLGQLLAAFEGNAIDTSDGLLFTLLQLFRVNNVGFRLNPQAIPYHPMAVDIMDQHNLPLALIALGEVGDYELLFAIPKEKVTSFEKEIQSQRFDAVCIGQCVAQKEIVLGKNRLALEALKVALDNAPDNKQYLQILSAEVSKWNL